MLSLTNGNLKIQIDPATFRFTATRVSDGRLLLNQTGLSFGPACPGARPGSRAVTASFVSGRAGP